MTTGWEHSHRRDPYLSPFTAHTAGIYGLRVLQTTAELIESYRLRYEVYGALGYLRSANASGLEIDEYDAAAIPFGAFELVSGEMIGTLRLITDEVQPGYARRIDRVLALAGDPALAGQAHKPRAPRLPSIVSAEVDHQIDAFNRDHLAVRELSRSIVRADYRGSGVSRGLMELGMAYAAQHAPVVLIGGCMPDHVAMYARYGYLQLPHTGLDRFDSVGQIAHAVVCRTDELPRPTRDHVTELLCAMAADAPEHVLEVGHGARAVVSFTDARRARRRVIEG